MQPVAEVVAACRERGVLVHVDAAAAAGHVPIAFDELGADLLSVSAHKLGGPPGIGALLVRRGLRLRPLLRGGDQERARRAGLEPVAADRRLRRRGDARCARRSSSEVAEQRRLTDRLRDGLAGDGRASRRTATPTERLPHLVCVGVDGVEPQAVLLGLDRAGVAAHSGSSCSSESLEPSPVLEAMGVDAHHSLRLSVGWSTTDADIDAALAALPRSSRTSAPCADAAPPSLCRRRLGRHHTACGGRPTRAAVSQSTQDRSTHRLRAVAQSPLTQSMWPKSSWRRFWCSSGSGGPLMAATFSARWSTEPVPVSTTWQPGSWRAKR